MIIYPSRIKGEEYPLMKGDIVVCITEHFQEFTFGKQYKLYSDFGPDNGSGPYLSLLAITSDLGNQRLPSYYSPTGYYFLPLHIWRELKINKVLEK
jgi:hypothetical protein